MLLERHAEIVALVVKDRKDVPDRLRVSGGLHQTHAGQSLHAVEVFLGDRAPACVPLVEVLELHAEDRALESVESPVEADLDVMMAPSLRVIAQAADARRVLVV